MAAYPGNTTPQNPDDAELTLKKILLALIGGGPSGPIPVAPSGVSSITPNFAAATAGQTVVIPANAIGAGILILTGTGTINSVDWPVGIPWNEPNKLAATVTLVLGTPGTARIYYGT